VPAAAGASTVPGCGVAASVGGVPVLVGKGAWVAEQLGGGTGWAAAGGQLGGGGGGGARTEVVVAAGGRVRGVLGFKDTLRVDAAATVAGLRGQGAAWCQRVCVGGCFWGAAVQAPAALAA
jgi:cation transport ATPase